MYVFPLYNSTMHKSTDIRDKGSWWCRKSTKHYRDSVMHSPSTPSLLQTFISSHNHFRFHFLCFIHYTIEKEIRQTFSVIAIWLVQLSSALATSIYTSLPVQYFFSLSSSPQHGQQSPSTLPSTTCAHTLLASLRCRLPCHVRASGRYRCSSLLASDIGVRSS